MFIRVRPGHSGAAGTHGIWLWIGAERMGERSSRIAFHLVAVADWRVRSCIICCEGSLSVEPGVSIREMAGFPAMFEMQNPNCGL